MQQCFAVGELLRSG